ncbi:hypothetical protein [Owenweeksia hongkongensis]|uniref:hypothetical protein n=1 Tax=Owenweeksia hongkongensis TaxID=253245 RepID=UPI003A8E2D97
MKSILSKVLFAISIITTLASCGGSTYMVDSWKAPGETIEKQDLKKVMVSVLTKNETSRRIAEDQVAGYSPVFTPSYKVLPTQKIALDTTVSKQILQKESFDAVLVFALKDKNTTQTYVPGTNYNYWGYHGYYYGSYYDPGYIQQDVNYSVETNLYSLKENKLLWSGMTTTVNPVSLEQTISEIVKEVYQRMQKDGLFPDTTDQQNP